MAATAAGEPAEESAVEALGFEALGDANRRQMLRILSGGAKPVQEIADAMTISRPAVSRHLRLLKDAGMVAERAHGTRRIYYLQERGIEAVGEYLERLCGETAARFRLLAENTKDGGHDRAAANVDRRGLLGRAEPESISSTAAGNDLGARPAGGATRTSSLLSAIVHPALPGESAGMPT